MSLKSLSSRSTSALKKRAQLCCERWEEVNPSPQCELFYLSSYQLLVSVVLSAQATDKLVNATMKPLYEKGFTPDDVVALGQAGVLNLIKRIGLANTKSKNVFRLTQLLLEKHQGSVPRIREELEALPGVGRKTANVILGELFGEPTIAVDTHVIRVSARLGFHKEKNPLKAELKLLEIFPKILLPKAHHWMVLHGRYVCKARKPACGECVLRDLCPSAPLFA